MSGRLTNLCIMAATIFVDHYLDHVYMYLMKDLTLSETLLAKHTYERFLALLGIESQVYHADNGCFTDKGFRDDCTSSNQTITFCGIGSNHQNGIAERKIKDITLGGQTLLLHAKRMFPEYISTILWPFAVKCYEDRLNNLVHHAEGRTPYETLASLDAAPCPTFILLVVHVTFWIIGCSQALERFPNGNLARGWVSMLGDCPLMHPMLH